MHTILIVEDDLTLAEELSKFLQNQGYAVKRISDFTNTLSEMLKAEADLVLLDITLPKETGETLLQKFRKEKNTPVIMLTSRTSEIDEVLSMSYGADDYISKPYNPTILLLRINAVLKRTNASTQNTTYRDIQVSTVKGTLVRGDQEEILTKNEMIVFSFLLDRQGEIVQRDSLMTALWDNEEYVNDNALTVCVSRLRTKLAKLGIPDAIETRKKLGYILK